MKTDLTQQQCKPGNQGMDVLPSSPASSLLCPQAHTANPHWSCRELALQGQPRQKCLSAIPGAVVCSLAHSKILGYVPGLMGGITETQELFCSPLPSPHAYFSLPSSKRFWLPSSTWQTFLPTPNDQTASGLQMHEEHQLCFQTFQCLKIRTVSVQILILFAVSLKNYCLSSLFSISYPPFTFTSTWNLF